MHLLDIDIDDTNLNPRAFKIMDNSIYEEALEAKNIILEITPPGCNYKIANVVNKSFVRIYNANILGLNSFGNRELPSIPDGLYKIKLSVAPNAKVYQIFNYFRNTKQVNQYMDLWSNLIQTEHKYTRRNFTNLRDKLWNIKEYINGAKFLAEDRNKTEEAWEVYLTMSKELEKLKALC